MTSAGLRIVELFRYGLVSLVALAVDLGLLELLHRFTTLHYLFSASLSFVAGGFVAYLLSVRFVFRHRRVDTAMTEGSIFIALGLVGLAINAMVLYWLVNNILSILQQWQITRMFDRNRASPAKR